MNIKDSINSIKQIYMSENAINMLLDFERVLDNCDIYAFDNWDRGELVEGPKIEKYFVTCKFMWPEKKMPDPKGAVRLLPYGIKVKWLKTHVDMPVEIKNSDDYRPGSKKGKLVKAPVWVVAIMMPKNLIKDIKQGYKEIAGEEIDLSDLEQAYEKSYDQQALTAPEGTEAPGAPAPQGQPNA